jgi:hypothetical protein
MTKLGWKTGDFYDNQAVEKPGKEGLVIGN